MHISISIAAIFLTFVVCITAYTQPEITVSHSEGYGNDYVKYGRRLDSRVSVPDVTKFGLRENWAYEHCRDGVWRAHTGANYTGYSYLLYHQGCRYENTGVRLRSFEVVGSSVNFTETSLSTYPDQQWQGVQTYYSQDSADVTIPFNSFVLLGSQNVEIFVNKNFQGMSICVKPHLGEINKFDDLIDNEEAEIGTYLRNIQNVFGIPAENLKSFRFGCKKLTNFALPLPLQSKISPVA